MRVYGFGDGTCSLGKHGCHHVANLSEDRETGDAMLDEIDGIELC